MTGRVGGWMAGAPWLAACSGDDGRSTVDIPECAEGQVALLGTVGERDVDVRRTISGGYSFINSLGEEEGTLEVDLGGGDRLFLAWPRLVANGDTVVARGEIDLSSSEGFAFGNCDMDGHPSRMTMDHEGGGGTFVLEALHRMPYCETSEQPGALGGCFRSPP